MCVITSSRGIICFCHTHPFCQPHIQTLSLSLSVCRTIGGMDEGKTTRKLHLADTHRSGIREIREKFTFLRLLVYARAHASCV